MKINYMTNDMLRYKQYIYKKNYKYRYRYTIILNLIIYYINFKNLNFKISFQFQFQKLNDDASKIISIYKIKIMEFHPKY